MTPKEKAFILVTQFHNVKPLEDDCNITIYEAKQCALIAVDEILDAVSVKKTLYLTDMTYQIYSYWSKVKEELNKI